MEETAVARLIAKLTESGVTDAAKFVNGLTEEQAATALAGMEAHDADMAALRERLMADPALRSVVCPASTWNSPEARYEVSKVAVAIIENTAAKHNLTVEALVAAMIENGDGMQHRIELHGTDPRFDGYKPGEGYYAFRCAVRDAVATATAERTAAERMAREAKRDAAWAARGMERCDRCGGAGGFSHWPDFTCYKCGGLGAVHSDEI